ncbi:unnamed protein product [Protopolystoma xenopodis]|uniref:Uncharacterized protein n=1 Tax=Protopolystoma xenopodis TaxID=117903 RepID=A0A448WP44_9PLAT|nr:unnamed protein product [Protopolystoma xenopodis]
MLVQVIAAFRLIWPRDFHHIIMILNFAVLFICRMRTPLSHYQVPRLGRRRFTTSVYAATFDNGSERIGYWLFSGL